MWRRNAHKLSLFHRYCSHYWYASLFLKALFVASNKEGQSCVYYGLKQEKAGENLKPVFVPCSQSVTYLSMIVLLRSVELKAWFPLLQPEKFTYVLPGSCRV